MFARTSVFIILALTASFVAAVPTTPKPPPPKPLPPKPSPPPSAPVIQCNTGPVQCCDSVQNSNDKEIANLLGFLGIVTGGDEVPIGVTCSPISVAGGTGSNSCTAQPVCCQNNTFNGVVAIGCNPININK
uniref:Hydrophobin n=1 Tax=Dictyonema glabratum TaxID=164459 RepID=Q8WZJ3_9AGAR|nr:hydrophobin 1 [Dictyonema glabratum]